MTRSNPGSPQGAVASGRGGGLATAAAASGPQRLLVHLVIPGEPVPKARPRVVRTGTYTPRKTAEAEARLLGYLKAIYPRLTPADDDMSVSMSFRSHGAGRGDIDNFQKLVLDAFNGRIWSDDRQVLEVYARKYPYSRIAETVITVHLLHGQQP